MKRKRKTPSARKTAGTPSKAMLLPIPRAQAANLVLRTRIVLESLRQGEVSPALVYQISQVVVVVNFITGAGYGILGTDFLKHTEDEISNVVLEADQTNRWQISEALIADLATVVNEYDRVLAQTPMLEIARASERLEQIVRANASTFT